MARIAASFAAAMTSTMGHSVEPTSTVAVSQLATTRAGQKKAPTSVILPQSWLPTRSIGMDTGVYLSTPATVVASRTRPRVPVPERTLGFGLETRACAVEKLLAGTERNLDALS